MDGTKENSSFCEVAASKIDIEIKSRLAIGNEKADT